MEILRGLACSAVCCLLLCSSVSGAESEKDLSYVPPPAPHVLRNKPRLPEYLLFHKRQGFFITGFPIGWMIEKQVLGNYWEGIPFGWDITDSKTLFIFVFWIIPVILRLRRRLSDYGFARWVIAASLFTIAMFLLPHSL